MAKEPTINNEDGINPEKAVDGSKANLLLRTQPDARTGNGVLQKLIRAPRYFNSPECSWPACNEHVEDDDEGQKENPKQRHKRCYICGGFNHRGKRCKKVTSCLICSKKGHLVMDCPNKNVKADSTSTPCLKCGSTGHDMFSCTNEYDAEDLKVIECYICKQVGHLCCVDQKAVGPREASCYNCGQSGHIGLECTKLTEVANGPQPSCWKCGATGHFKRQCTKATAVEKDGAATKAEKRKARKSRRRKKANIPMNQPHGVWWLPITVGLYYGKPGSNVWLSPVAAAATTSNLGHQAEALPSRQHIYHHQIGTQVANSFEPFAELTHRHWSPQIGTQFSQPNLNHKTEILLPQTQAPKNSSGSVNSNSISNLDSRQQPLSHEMKTMLPPHQVVNNQIVTLPPLPKYLDYDWPIDCTCENISVCVKPKLSFLIENRLLEIEYIVIRPMSRTLNDQKEPQ